MPDIAMCQSEECPKRQECYRHEAEPDEVQSYAIFYVSGRECGFFIPIKKGENGNFT